MNRKIKFSILLILCVAFTGVMLIFGMNTLKAEATEREITASGTSGEVNWTLYDDGELYIYGEGTLNATVTWGDEYLSIKKITIGKDVKYNGEHSVSLKSTAGYKNLERISVEEGNMYFSTDETGALYNYDKTIIYLFPIASEVSEYTAAKSVMRVGDAAFAGSKNLKTVTFGEDLHYINDSAFYYSDIEAVNLSDSLISIGEYAFLNSNIKAISLPDTVRKIGKRAFANCDYLSEITIPSKVTVIEEGLFYNCNILETLNLPKNLKKIEKEAFRSCKNLKEIELPDSVTTLANHAFSDCSNLTKVNIPPEVKTIPFEAFWNCYALKSVELSNGITTIGNYAFLNCKSLASITIPESVTSIIGTAFNGCQSLSNITVAQENSAYCSKDGVLFNKDKTILVLYPAAKEETSYEIPETVIEINSYAFNGAAELAFITVPEGIEYIGNAVFTDSGFYNDAANWDNGFLYLDNYLVAVNNTEIPYECKLYSKTKLIAEKIFYNIDSITKITMPDTVEYINDSAFYDCNNLQAIHLSDNLKNIGEYAFYGCSALSDINIPENVTLISEKTFSNCSSLESVVLNEGLCKIEGMAFASTPALTEIHIPQTVTTLASDAFKSSGITDIHYGDSKAQWKRLANGATFNDATVHYTLRSDDESVIIHHTDNNFDWEAGNVHLVVEDLGNVSSSYEQNGFYNRLMVDPIQVLDIKLVDGDGNSIQPLSDETITVKIKSSEEFKAFIKTGLAAVSDYDLDAENIDFRNDCFVFEVDGETVSVPADEGFLKKFKIIHWYSDATEPTDHESFTHDELTIENGYIILETNHFSEYAVCTELVNFGVDEKELANGESVTLSVTVTDGTEVTYTSSDESVVNVDENGTITAVGPGTATITVTINGTNISDTCKVTVPARDFTVKWIVDGIATEQTVTEESIITEPENPEKEGYTFIGWTPEVPDTMPAENLEFTAVWQVNEYTITFDAAGGTAIAPITLEYGAAITSPANPEKEGFTFVCWTPELPETMPANDLTVVAVYEEAKTPDIPDTPDKPEITVTGIKIISLPNKTKYTYKADGLDLSGIAVKEMYSDGTSKIITDTNAFAVHGFNVESVGTKTITVAYGSYTDEFEITVSYAWWQWIIRILLLGFIWY